MKMQKQQIIKTINITKPLTNRDYSDFYKEVLKFKQPKNIMEWGPGIGLNPEGEKGNTQLALELTTANIVTTEQDIRWVPPINKRMLIMHTPVESNFYTKIWNPDADIFFVDSRKRQECLDKVHSMCSKTAIICCHDAERDRYKKHIEQFTYIIYCNNKRFAIMTEDIEQGEQLYSFLLNVLN